jgi:sigma-B regulation protein RsbU (phosphoserine phosphatase)
VAAALLTACACTTCQMMASDAALGPGTLVTRLSDIIRKVGKGELLMTFFAAHIDTARREVAFASAGHPAPYHLRAGGATPTRLGVLATGPTHILGSREAQAAPVKEHRVALAPGDVLVFYTDGLVECENPEKEPFGTTALHRLLRGGPGAGAGALRDRIMEAALAHYRGEPRVDDITLVVVRVAA